MQSIRQYRHIREKVRADLAAGKLSTKSPDHLPTPRALFDGPNEGDSTTSSDRTLVGQQKGSVLVENQQPILVEWDGADDPLSPRNWSMSYRCWIFVILWINVFAIDWASSADSQVGNRIAAQFGISAEAETLSPSLYTFGLASGAVFAGSIAETVGRNPIYVLSRCLHVAWLLGAALAPNFAAQCIFRLFAGLSGSILLAIHSASVADMFGPVHRTIAWPLMALASFWGTSFAPVVGAWIEQARIDWRWADWIPFIMSGSTLMLTLFFLPETFSPILLKWKAEHVRKATGDARYQAELDLQSTLLHRFGIAWQRALHMITREPIVVLLGIWIVFEYVVVFGFLQGFTFIFADTYGLSTGLTGTCFVALAVGCTLWTAGIPIYYHFYKKKVLHMKLHQEQECNLSDIHKYTTPGSELPEPEYRLWSALLAAPAFPISLFWLGWTNYAWISPWSNIGSVVLLGFSWAGIYTTVYQYILDVYGIYAGSALSIITCWRYLVSGAINLGSKPMYGALGVHWTATWLGCVAALLMPAPLVFYFYGPSLRRKSKFASMYSRPGNPRLRVGVAAGWKE